MAVQFENVHGFYPGCKVVEKFTGKEKLHKGKDGKADYTTQARVVKVIGMGYEKTFFYGGSEAERAAFASVPEAGPTRFDLVVPVEKGRDGKDRLGMPRFFPEGSVIASKPEIGVPSMLDDSAFSTGRKAA